jgi:hypothetical protein
MLNIELLRLVNNNVLTTEGQNMGHYKQGSAQEELCFEFREDITTTSFVEFCQEGIGRVHRMHREELSFKF